MHLAVLAVLGHKGAERCAVTKILPLLLVLLMGLHIIKPFGLPGLKRRSDFWKIGVISILAMALAVGFHLHEG
ncbi:MULTISPECIES: hypothetical protein [Brucella]|nr:MULTISPECIES: hypothetical protein [Brucella]ERM85987.1 hypothetical protein P865_11195 [Brucella abortus 82]ERT83854.1 hypothetical protein P050_01659 [Brucella abortus 90-12178]ERU05671.1 hypothetical protein P038_01144 [Brucella abortus 99-9971-135]ERU06336.1 hypothetical protein P039_01285 [Brucella abortus 07-0994-2411]EXU82238.1 hypothetical protein AX23_15255 [Brucella melitensis 548]KEX95540.1 hypothetical protein IL60_0216110 [Brucella inopinata BO1]KFH20777.1 hypothetical protei